MGDNIYLIIMAGVLLICLFSGRWAGLIRPLIPVITLFLSVMVLSVVYSILKADVVNDARHFALLDIIIDILAFAAAFFILKFLIKVALKLVSLIGDVPIIGSVNRILGSVVGVVGGVILIWTVLLVMALFVGESKAPDFYRAVSSNPILGYIYNHNLLMTFINYFIFVK